MHLVAIGGSDAGISAALRARELDPTTEVTVVVADAYPNFSICGIPYYVSGEVTHWRNLAHRTLDDLKSTGMQVRLNTLATKIDVAGRRLQVVDESGVEDQIAYDQLVVGTGAVSARPPIEGLVGPEALGPADGVHLLHSMGDTFALVRTLEEKQPASAVIVGAGYIGLEMAEGLTARGLSVTQFEQLPEVLPTVDPSLGALVHAELTTRGIDVRTGMTVERIARAPKGSAGRFRVDALDSSGTELSTFADVVLVVVGVRPDTELAVAAGAELGVGGAISVDRGMRTNLERVFAAGDCVVTHHRLFGLTYLPLGTTAHKQGRVAGENALGDTGSSPGASGPRSSRSSTWWRRAPGCATTRRWPPGSTRSPSSSRPTITRPTTRAATASGCASPATARPAGCWVSSSSAIATPRWPSASTSPPPPSSTT